MFLDSDDYLYPLLDEFMQELDGTDIVYYGLIQNNGTKLMPNKNNIQQLCGTVKAIKKEFIGKVRYPLKNFAEDYFFNMDLLGKHPSKKFTGIYLLHYNHPRKGSLFDLGTKKGDD